MNIGMFASQRESAVVERDGKLSLGSQEPSFVAARMEAPAAKDAFKEQKEESTDNFEAEDSIKEPQAVQTPSQRRAAPQIDVSLAQSEPDMEKQERHSLSSPSSPEDGRDSRRRLEESIE